jgi:probable F420-dependent oxidoreductase
MKYGFTIPGSGPLATPEAMVAAARRGEELGYDCLTASDHIVLPRKVDSLYPYNQRRVHPSTSAGSCLEQLTVLSFLAGQTNTLRLVTSVMILPHRNPIIAAKALATLDVLSQGRLTVGVGVGWMREEFETLGLSYFEERGDVTNEFIRAFKELWTSDDPSFEGRYCRFSNIGFLPQPVQKPHPPIWVGGESRAAIRRAARLADGWHPVSSRINPQSGGPERLTAGINSLRLQAEAVGRDPEEISVIYRVHGYGLVNGAAPSSAGERHPFSGDADQIASDIRRYEALGVSQLVVDFAGPGSSVRSDLGKALQDMEDFATQVWPRV